MPHSINMQQENCVNSYSIEGLSTSIQILEEAKSLAVSDKERVDLERIEREELSKRSGHICALPVS